MIDRLGYLEGQQSEALDDYIVVKSELASHGVYPYIVVHLKSCTVIDACRDLDEARDLADEQNRGW